MIKYVSKAALLAGVFLSVQAIQAEIIYSGPSRNLVLDQFNTVQTIDIAGNCMAWGDLAIELWINEHPNSGIHTQAATLPKGQENQVKTAATKGMIDKLPEHYAVNASLNYTIAKSSFFNHQYSCKLESAECNGNFLNQTGYIALQLSNLDETYYGWVRISAENYNRKDVRLTVHDWAYNNTPGQEILTGQTSVPEPSSMAMTAACSGGLLFFRRIFLI
jgi:hypothetical protein